MRASRWMGCVVGGAVVLASVAGYAQSAWPTPPPLAPGATWRAAAPTGVLSAGDALTMTPESFVAGVPQCEDTGVFGRIVAETLAAGVGVVGTGMLVAYMVNSSDNIGMATLTFAAGLTSYMLLTPLAVHGVSRTFGGNGKMWAALLGGLLVPVIGHVVGYELSHTPECSSGLRTAHARRPPSLATAAEAQRLRWAPVLAPTGQGGALMGLTVAF